MIRWACGLLFRDFCTVPMRATLFPVEFRLLQVLKQCSQRMRASSLGTLYKLIYLLIGATCTQKNNRKDMLTARSIARRGEETGFQSNLNSLCF